MKRIDYLESIVKIPGIRGVYVFDENGKEVYRESTFSRDKEYYKPFVESFLKNKEKFPKILYFFTEKHLLIIAHNEEIFKGFLISISFKDVNLGLLRIKIKKFLNID
jgi:predicted regulator of Ras-like GTPase activity (Roadblock/LC7/MglB family)